MIVRLHTPQRLGRLYRLTERRGFRRGFAAVCCLGLLMVAGPVLLGVVARLSYNGRSYAAAQRVWRLQAVVAWYDKDIPPANAGLAYYQLGMLTPAVDQLEHALAIAPSVRQCRIRWNLAIVLATRAEQQAQSNPNDAIGDYARAINVLDNDYCLSQPEYRDKFQQYSEALTAKMEALIAQISAEHKRPEDNDKQQPNNEPAVSDEEKTKKEIEQRSNYQNSTTYNRYNQQSQEEQIKGYTESVW